MPDDLDLLIPYGQDIATGRMLHASAVPSGLACNCVCPACGARLVARHGHGRPNSPRDHFAHEADNPNCASAVETALHKAAKQIIADAREVWQPPLYPRHPNGNPALQLVQPAGRIRLAQVEVEPTRWLPALKPDLFAISAAGTPLFIEIHVQHAVDEPKAALIRGLGIAAIEITLANFRHRQETQWRDAVLRFAPRRWLHHHRQAEIDAELARQLAAQAARIDAMRQEQQAVLAAQRAANETLRAAQQAAQQEAAAALQAARAVQHEADYQALVAANLAREDNAGTSQRCHICGKPNSPFGFGLPPQPTLWACRQHRAQVDQIWKPALTPVVTTP